MEEIMDWQRFDTESGAPLWFLHLLNVKNTSIGVLTNVGSRDEKWPEEAGLAHALEHMFFQGSTASLKTQKAMSAYTEDVGGISNAYTGNEETFYFHKIGTNEIARSIKVLGESLFYPRFQRNIIPTQMKIVLQEMATYDSLPYTYLGNNWVKWRMAGHPLSQVTIGLKEAIENFKQEDFFRFAKKYYHPGNFTYIAVGGANQTELLNHINVNFPKNHKRNKHERWPCTIPKKPEGKLLLPWSAERAYISSASVFPAISEKEACALKLFQKMIDGGTSFPLFLEVREKHGFCYSIHSQVDQESDITLFGINIETSPQNHEKALDLALKVINKERKNKKLLKRTKILTKGNISLIDNTMNILLGAAKKVSIDGIPRSFEETMKDYGEITIDEISNIVEKYLKPENFCTGVLLPKK